jgi:hypothetical protein
VGAALRDLRGPPTTPNGDNTMSTTPNTADRSWSVYAYTSAGHAVTLSEGLYQAEAKGIVIDCMKSISGDEGHPIPVTISTALAVVRVGSIEAVAMKRLGRGVAR